MRWFRRLVDRSDASHPGEPTLRSVTFSTNGLRVEHRAPDAIEWVDLWGDRAVARLERSVEWRASAFDTAALRAHYRIEAAARDGAIVSVDLIHAAGLPIARVITKIPARPTYVYEGLLVVPLKDARFTLTLHTRELDTTGMREAAVSSFLLNIGWLPMPTGPKGPTGGVRLERWFFDPYDAFNDDRTICSVADDERLDDLFEKHPLSKLRRWLRTVAESLKVDVDVRAVIDAGWAPSDVRTRVEEQVPVASIGTWFLMNGRLDAAEALVARSVPPEGDQSLDTGTETAQLLLFLGLTREMHGKIDEAADAFARALRIFQARVGDQDVRTAQAGCHLGRMHVARGRLEEAEPLLDRALACFVEREAETDAAIAANDLGLLCQQRSDHRAAVSWFEMADTRFERGERAQGKPIPDRALVLNNLGKSLDELGDHKAASAARARARTIGATTPP